MAPKKKETGQLCLFICFTSSKLKCEELERKNRTEKISVTRWKCQICNKLKLNNSKEKSPKKNGKSEKVSMRNNNNNNKTPTNSKAKLEESLMQSKVLNEYFKKNLNVCLSNFDLHTLQETSNLKLENLFCVDYSFCKDGLLNQSFNNLFP